MASNHQQHANGGTNYSDGDPNNYECWGNQDFNLLEFVGQEDDSPLNPNAPDQFGVEEEDMHKGDQTYTGLQYNNLVCELPMGESLAALLELGPDVFEGLVPALAAPPSAPPAARSVPTPPRLKVVVSDGYAEAPQLYGEHHQLATPPTYPRADTALYGNGRMDGSQMPSTSRTSAMPAAAVKAEPAPADYYDSESDQHDDRHSMETESQAGGGPMRAYQPRKYRVKSEVEKKQPSYKVKRERNNDAVRRSRDKAKREQEAKEDRLCYLEQQRTADAQTIKQLVARNSGLEKALLQVKQQCRCSAARRVLP